MGSVWRPLGDLQTGQQKEASGWLLDYFFVRNRIREHRTESFRGHGGLQLVSPLGHAGPWETGPQVGHTTHDEQAAKMKTSLSASFPTCVWVEEENSQASFSIKFWCSGLLSDSLSRLSALHTSPWQHFCFSNGETEAQFSSGMWRLTRNGGRTQGFPDPKVSGACLPAGCLCPALTVPSSGVPCFASGAYQLHTIVDRIIPFPGEQLHFNNSTQVLNLQTGESLPNCHSKGWELFKFSAHNKLIQKGRE